MTSFVPPTELSLPVTERTNHLTTSLDVSSSVGMVRQLRQCDAQIFTGYEDFPSLTDDLIKRKIHASIACCESILSANLTGTNASNGRIILSGSGTSGRLGMLVSRDLNRVVRTKMGPTHPLPFGYTISGNDAAMLLSDELPEDDPVTAVFDLQRETKNTSKVCLIGITCGLSAPYVAGQVDYILDCNEEEKQEQTTVSATATATEWSTIMIGFNPDHLSRDRPIEIWKDRDQHRSSSVRDVVLRLHAKEKATTMNSSTSSTAMSSAPSFVLLNPIVGPEPICASSRMKGGTCTKILLDVVLGIATARVYGTCFQAPLFDTSKVSATATHPALLDNTSHAVDSALQAFDTARRVTYETTNANDQLSSLIDAVGASFKHKEGHLYYLGASTGGILGIIDASEMPDTYGAPFEQTRAFLQGSWKAMENVQGDLSASGPLYHIGVTHFVSEIMPTLSHKDTIILIEDCVSSLHMPNEETHLTLATICIECAEKYNAAVGRIGFDSAAPSNSPIVNTFVRVCGPRYISYPLPSHALMPGHYCGYDTLTIKLALNIITTCGQIHAGMVYENHMINTGPTNAKIYDRCVRLIARFSHCDYPKEAQVALLRSIWTVDVVTKEMLEMPQVSFCRCFTRIEHFFSLFFFYYIKNVCFLYCCFLVGSH